MIDIILTTQNAPPKSVFWGKEDNNQHIKVRTSSTTAEFEKQKQHITIDWFVATRQLCCWIVRVHYSFRSKRTFKTCRQECAHKMAQGAIMHRPHVICVSVPLRTVVFYVKQSQRALRVHPNCSQCNLNGKHRW